MIYALSAATIADPARLRVVMPRDVPNLNWLRPGAPSAGQQSLGYALLAAHPFVLVPSVVSSHSWNVIFDPGVAMGLYGSLAQEPFALDTRLHPPRGGTARRL